MKQVNLPTSEFFVPNKVGLCKKLLSLQNILYVESLTQDNLLHIIYNMKKSSPPQGTKSMTLVKQLAEHGYRVFSVQDVQELNIKENLEIISIKQALRTLSSKGWIHFIRRNLYALDAALLGGVPINEFEIATHIAQPSAISHYSAFYIHELTEQIPRVIFTSVPTGTSLPRTKRGELYTYEGVRYQFIQVKKEEFFGMSHIWHGNAKIPVTDLERTLLDGLAKPKYCGGFADVIHAFTVKDIDVKKIISYALKLNVSVAKRLGWVLEKTGYKDEEINFLAELPFKGFIKLDASREKRGPYNHRWQIQENL